MKVGKYFTLKEFQSSEIAKKNGYTEQFELPPFEVIENIRLLATIVADPIRDFFGPFSPTNGWRCERLNKAVKGAKNSKHTKGQAFDETFIKDGKNVSDTVFFWLLENKDTVHWTKIIWEYGNVDCPAWLHIEYVKGEKQRVFVKKSKNPVYLNYYNTDFYKIHKGRGKVWGL